MKKRKDPNKPLSERETRLRIFADCRKNYGPEAERQLRMTFDKWDRLLAKCTNPEEAKHIRVMAAAEIHQMMGYRGGLTVGGKVIITDDE